jgi:formylglycine-generating enzyme required for sulfatase activity
MTCLNAQCENHRKDLGAYKFCPECGSVTLPQDGSVYSGSVGTLIEVNLSPWVRQSFCFIPHGFFLMGSQASEKGRNNDEKYVEVTISHPLWLAKTQVTRTQWKAVMRAQWKAVMRIDPLELERPDDLPVDCVSWYDVQAYLARLNEKQILPRGWKFALPTEAQWEYACRAGETGPYSGGNLDEVGWYGGNSGEQAHKVGLKKPNAWGLHDMHGNVYEWCADWYDDTLKGGIDPTGPSSGRYRVSRGGSWDLDASYCRAAYRFRFHPGYRNYFLGFRPALVPTS